MGVEVQPKSEMKHYLHHFFIDDIPSWYVANRKEV
jgi:hypothetical protein